MAKSREGRDVEYYLGQIRELKAENRNLKKRLKQLERREHHYEEQELKEIIEDTIISKQRCPECAKGVLEEKTVVGRFWVECSLCNYRSKTKKI